MEILEVEFTYNSLFEQSQIITLIKNNICFIGENGVGKTTLLKILKYILGDMNFDIRRHDLEEIDYTIKLSLSEKEFNYFFNQLKYTRENSIFYISGNNKKNRDLSVKSSSFSQEFDQVRNRIETLNRKYKQLISEYSQNYDNFSFENVFKSQIPLWYSLDYLDEKCFDQILNCKENFVKDDTLVDDKNHDKTKFYLFYGDSLFYDYKRESDYLKDMRDFFSEFIKYGESKVEKLTDQFIIENKHIENKIFEIINEIIIKGEKFDRLFNGYSGFKSYIKNNYKHKIRFLSAINDYHRDKITGLFEAVLYQYQEDYYQDIFEGYEQSILNEEISKDFIYNLIKLEAFGEESNPKSIEFYKDSNIPLADMKEYKTITEEPQNIISNLKTLIFNRNIVKDFNNKFEGLYYFIDREIILSNVEEELNLTIPKFESKNIKYFKIVEDKSSIQILFKEKGRDELTNLSDTSSGRQWYYLYKMVLNSLDEDDILIIDEPASFLHLKAQREILDELLSIEQKVIYTTHSPLLLPMDYNESSLYSLRKILNKTHVLKIEDGLDDEIIKVFGLNQIRNIIIKSFNQLLLIPEKQRKKLSDKGIIVDTDYIDLFEDVNKYIKTSEFLRNYHVTYETVLDEKRIESFREKFQDDKFYSVKDLIEFYENNHTSTLLSNIIIGVEKNERTN